MSHFKLALKIAATGALVALLLRVASAREIFEAMRGASPPWLLAMYSVALVARAVEASLFRSLLEYAGVTLGLRRVFFASALSGFYGLITPGDVVASFAKWRNLSAAAGSRSLVLSAILYNRLVLLVVPLTAGVCALWHENPDPDAPLLEIAVAMWLAIVTVGIVTFHPTFGPSFDRVVRAAGSFLPDFATHRIETLLESLELIRSVPLLAHAKHLLISTAYLAGILASTALLCRALELNVPVWGLVLLQSVLILSAHAQVTIAGFGVREAVFLLVLGTYGVPHAAALAAGLLAFTTRLVFATIGGLYQVTLMFGWADARSR